MFYLGYHLHWPPSEILDLDLGDRQAYVQRLGERIAEENRALQAQERAW